MKFKKIIFLQFVQIDHHCDNSRISIESIINGTKIHLNVSD